jgi:tRNA A-37 threonylcarbamoyl transferase component Bud32
MLDLSYNHLNGSIPPDFLSHPGLQSVDLTSNMLEGTIPNSLSRSLFRLRLGGNKLGGNIPNSICDGMSLAYLELDNNQLMGNIPSELAKCKKLSLLNLASNQLQGPLPDGISSLEELVVLKLQNNSLNGHIPNTFSASLSTLNLSQNSFTGQIPSRVFELQKLSTLDLHGNNIGGGIPISISSSVSLIELNLGYNALTGTIPTMATTLSTSLNLSHNYLSGSIPSNLGSLIELEILDLSYNNLSGEVPSSLGSMQSLTQLVLSYNHLSGSVPRFRQDVEIDIEGNADLINGNGNDNSISTTGKKKPHNAVIIIFTIAGAVFGLCMLAVIVTMSLSKRIYRAEGERRSAGEGVSQIINGSLVMDNHQTSATEFMKAKPDNWQITPFQALNFEVADILQELTEENFIGSGGSGHVYRVTYSNRYNSSTGVVAVKQIRSVGWLDEKLEREFESEASILCNIRHNNIVKLLCCLSSSESKLLVYDYMDNGCLDKWLHGSVVRSGHSMARTRSVQHVPLDWPTRLIVAVGAAQGLCYMHHDCSPPIVHRDVKTSNILLDSEFRAKVADFGLARMLVRAGEPNTMSAVAGSFGYLAPGEVLPFLPFMIQQMSHSFCRILYSNWSSSCCGYRRSAGPYIAIFMFMCRVCLHEEGG